MHSKTRSIDDMPHLKTKLGKARVDRIRYAGLADASKQKHATNIENTILTAMQSVIPHQPDCPVADVLYGVSYLDGHTKPLSVNRLYNILQCMETVNTREVKAMMAIDDRQAQRYVRAIKFVMPFISRKLPNNK